MTELEKVKADLPFKPDVGESHAAFEAFLCYFDIGRNRSCGEVARRMGVSGSATRRWSGKFKWKQRMAAYHEQLLRARVEVDLAAKRDVASLWVDRTQAFKEREWAAAEHLLAAAQAVLDSFTSRDPADISLLEAARALEIASKLGRLATGLATEHQELTGPDNGPLQIEISAALKKIYGLPFAPEPIEPPPNPPPLNIPDVQLLPPTSAPHVS
jgi:hypothetical protein